MVNFSSSRQYIIIGLDQRERIDEMCIKKERWLSRRQGLEKEAGLRRIPLQPAG
jgi:hypothetical protein